MTKQTAKKHIIFSLVFIFILCIVWIVLTYFSSKNIQKDQRTVTIGSIVIPVEIADTDEKRTKGLSERETLDIDSGMLFVFDNADRYPFWMPDMYFPIDIVWINQGVVSGIDANVSNEFDSNNPKNYYPPSVADMVLEVNAGFTETRGIHVGDTVFLSVEKE